MALLRIIINVNFQQKFDYSVTIENDHRSEVQKTIHWFAIVGEEDYLNDEIGIFLERI